MWNSEINAWINWGNKNQCSIYCSLSVYIPDPSRHIIYLINHLKVTTVCNNIVRFLITIMKIRIMYIRKYMDMYQWRDFEMAFFSIKNIEKLYAWNILNQRNIVIITKNSSKHQKRPDLLMACFLRRKLKTKLAQGIKLFTEIVH